MLCLGVLIEAISFAILMIAGIKLNEVLAKLKSEVRNNKFIFHAN